MKTTDQEVLDYIVRMEAYNKNNTGVSGIYPTIRQIALAFNISDSRACQYQQLLQKKLNRVLKLKKRK